VVVVAPPLDQLLVLDTMDVAGNDDTKRVSQVIQSNLFYDPNKYYIVRVIELLRALVLAVLPNPSVYVCTTNYNAL